MEGFSFKARTICYKLIAYNLLELVFRFLVSVSYINNLNSSTIWGIFLYWQTSPFT